MKKVLTILVCILAVTGISSFVTKVCEAALARCELEVEKGDDDDPCVVNTIQKWGDAESCTLAKILKYTDSNLCAIDNDKEGTKVTAIFIGDPIPSNQGKSKNDGGCEVDEFRGPQSTSVTEQIIIPGTAIELSFTMISGLFVNYPETCLGNSCDKIPSGTNWADHVIKESYAGVDGIDLLNGSDWAEDCDKGQETYDPTFLIPDGNNYNFPARRTDINIDISSATAAFQLKYWPDLRFRYVNLVLQNGAAMSFETGKASFYMSGIEVEERNSAEFIFDATKVFHPAIYFGADKPIAGNNIILSKDESIQGETPKLQIVIHGHDDSNKNFSIIKIDDSKCDDSCKKALVKQLKEGIQFLESYRIPNFRKIPASVSLLSTGGPIDCTFIDKKSEKAVCKLPEGFADERVIVVEKDGQLWSEGVSTNKTLELDYAHTSDGNIIFQAAFDLLGRRINVEINSCPDGSIPDLDATLEDYCGCGELGDFNKDTWQCECTPNAIIRDGICMDKAALPDKSEFGRGPLRLKSGSTEPPETVTCGANEHLVEDACVCNDGYEKTIFSDTCTSICGTVSTWDPVGAKCICNETHEWDGTKCILKPSDTKGGITLDPIDTSKNKKDDDGGGSTVVNNDNNLGDDKTDDTPKIKTGAKAEGGSCTLVSNASSGSGSWLVLFLMTLPLLIRKRFK